LVAMWGLTQAEIICMISASVTMNSQGETMKRTLMLFLILLSSAAIASAQGAAAGKGIFASKCALCHGPDGKGNTSIGKSLKIADLHSDVVQKMSNADLKTFITNGKNKMPPFKGKLTDTQMDQVISYIRELAK